MGRHRRVLTVLAAFLAVVCNHNHRVLSVAHCDRTPVGVSLPKTPGDNGFTLTIAGKPEKYVPEETYRVSLKGQKMSHSTQKFAGFMISVKREDGSDQSAGTFQLLGNAAAKFSDSCPNALVHTSRSPKSEVEVIWKAPKRGSGCVVFQATVLEYLEVWYMDEGHLNQRICEESAPLPHPTPNRKQCCACDEAKYELTFQGTWSKHTHPKDFPENLFETHFSDIIGASHNSRFTMWAPGEKASNGMEDVAEMGSNRAIESEMKTQADNIKTIIKARGLWYPKLNSSAFAVFNVDRHHHLISLATMLGPSPDWIVGVSGLDLCIRDNCSWVPQVVLDLYPYDAGTDSGITYKSLDVDTVPKEDIRQITSSYPNHPDSPFFDVYGEPMKPVARLTVTMQRRYEKSCNATPDPGRFFGDPVEIPRPECMVTEWGDFSPCSDTCGEGTRTARRFYKDEAKASMNMCKEQLEKTEPCEGRAGTCRCATKPWTEWGECSAECGMGVRTRTRTFVDRKSRKTCFVELREDEPCKGPHMNCDPTTTMDPECAVTEWSDWSPCSVTCGKGEKMRTRLHRFASSQPHCNVELMQKKPCMQVACSAEATSLGCMEDKDVGPCRSTFMRWYFDKTTASCQKFIYGGCKGTRNRFDTYEDCKRACVKSSVPIESNVQSHIGNEVIDCMVSEWTGFGPCSKTCGKGHKISNRMIKVHPQNGGKSCPTKLVKKKNCHEGPCPRAYRE